MLNSVSIIPTGNEILNGIVIDTNSPAIMQIILDNYPACKITRLVPVMDKEVEIVNAIDRCVTDMDDLIIIIGGSGGGHRYVSTLSEDYTHSAMLKYLEKYSTREIYGKNGHLWSKIVCGRKKESLIINVPGPYIEATSAIKTLIKSLMDNVDDENIICEKVANTVLSNYPSSDGVRCVEI